MISNKFSLLISLLIICFSLSAQQNDISNSYILKTTKEVTNQDLKQWGFEITQKIPTLEHTYIVEYILKSSFRYGKIKDVKWIQYLTKNKSVESRSTIPNDLNYPEQWHLTHIHAPEFWDMNTGGLTAEGDTIVIAIVDKEFDINHEDLQGNFWHNPGEIDGDNIDNDNNGYVDDITGWNFINNTNIYNQGIHGNYVTGALGARGNNSIGISGVNWHIKYMLFTISNSAEIIQAYGYIKDQRLKYNNSNGEEGAFIVVSNLSLGLDNQFAEDYPIWCEMYDILGEVGIVSVAATTNNDAHVDETGDMPSTCTSPYLIVTTNSNMEDTKETAGYSTKFVDLAAPGKSIYTTALSNQYKSISGTSLSTPLVSGAVALMATLPSDTLNRMFKSNPSTAAMLLKKSILDGVTPSFDLEKYTLSGGRLDLMGAFEGFKMNLGANQEKATLNLLNNPATQILKIQYTLSSDAATSLDVYDTTGRRIITKSIEGKDLEYNIETLDVTGLANGLYFLALTNGHDIVTQKFIKK